MQFWAETSLMVQRNLVDKMKNHGFQNFALNKLTRNPFKHGTTIRTRITSKKIRCYMRDSGSR